jgi:hypothetical protein
MVVLGGGLARQRAPPHEPVPWAPIAPGKAQRAARWLSQAELRGQKLLVQQMLDCSWQTVGRG